MKKNLSDLLREEVTKESNPEGESTPKTSRRRKSPTSEPETSYSTELLESQVKTLESELGQQQKLVKTLQEQVQEKETLETEIKQLSKQLEQSHQEKETLSEQLNEVQNQLKDQQRLVEKLYAELMDKHDQELSEPEPEPEPPEPKPEPKPSQAIIKQYRTSNYHIERLIAPNGSSKTLSDEVIGWFD